MLSDKDRQELHNKTKRLKSKQNLLKKTLNKEKKDNSPSSEIAGYAHIGFEFIGTFLLFFFIGLYLDKKFNGNSLILIIFIFAGFSISIYRLIRSTQNIH